MTKMYFQYLIKKLKYDSREPNIECGYANPVAIPSLKIGC